MKLSPSLFSRLNPGKPPWRVLFFGTDKFAVHPLQNLLERMQDGSLIENVELVCPPERRRAINKKVQNENFITAREYAIEEGIPIHEWKGKEGWAPEYSPGGPYDIGVVASFGYLIPNNVIDLCPSGMVNIHPSILPKWRGAAPMTHAILSGASHTGVSIVGVSRDRFDHGKILLQENYKIRDDIMYDDLSDELAILGSRMHMPRYPLPPRNYNPSKRPPPLHMYYIKKR
ncbi:predicted protein [Nematostella vectensis]|uniref:methionyl-tRNA formyltransferase n=1 Tax=Nematostella vectensis TaxID=45351 RepID=A7T543_NEMVE|nr:predicted protein [Nematostella vectensis]|eukprot:XP_001621020.1 hypothetical protein NEMVEDRAFT_v1g222453 [Nematostella vectensis]